MSQQINLYPKLPKLPKYHLTARLGLQICAAFLALQMIGSVFSYWQQDEFNEQYEALVQQRDQVRQQLTQLKIRAAGVEQLQNLQEKSRLLNQELSFKTAVIQQLNNRASGKVIGFSKCLESLANAAEPNVWLRRFTLQTAEGNAQLIGSAKKNDDVMAYISRLSKQPCFNNKIFDDLQFDANKSETDKNTANIIHFDVSAEAKGK